MDIKLLCNYCGFNWEYWAASRRQIESLCCPKCNDSSLTVKDTESSPKIDYYKGCPPFPEDDTNTRDDPATKPRKQWYWENSQSSKSSTNNNY
jgi:uncharacterized protein YbaR (Trm112 family)